MCPAICRDCGPTSLPYYFDFPGQLTVFILSNRYFIVVPGLSRKNVRVFWLFIFLMRRVSPLLFHQHAKVCILESHLRRRCCVERAWFNTHPAVDIPRSYRHLRTFRCGRDLDTTHSSSFWCCILFAIVLGAAQAGILGTASGAEMADVEQMKKIVPFVTCEITFGQNVCDLMFGVKVSNLNFRIKINSVKQPIQSNSEFLTHVSLWASAFDCHVNHGFIILKNIQHSTGNQNVFRVMEHDS